MYEPIRGDFISATIDQHPETEFDLLEEKGDPDAQDTQSFCGLTNSMNQTKNRVELAFFETCTELNIDPDNSPSAPLMEFSDASSPRNIVAERKRPLYLAMLQHTGLCPLGSRGTQMRTLRRQ
jgi:hypothetical protein